MNMKPLTSILVALSLLAALPPQAGAAAPPTISDNGPWLVFDTGEGLAAVDANGAGLIRFSTPALMTKNELARGASPTGEWLAFRSANRDNFTNTQLNLLHLPDGKLTTISRLLSPELEQAAEGRSEAAIAVSEPDALAWSPDGRYLAFVAAIDGPSSDLYVYDTHNAKVTRLTNGPNETASLMWSPDSKSIVHLEVEHFGTGAGWAVKAAWAAPVAGGRARRLYRTTSGGEIWMGWPAPDTFGVYTYRPISPDSARLVNVRTGRNRAVYAGTFAEAALGPGGALAFIATDYERRLAEGLYFVSAPGRKPGLIAKGQWERVAWLAQAERFVASGPQGVLSFATDGEQTRIDEMPWFAASPDGARLAFWGHERFDARPGVRVYTAGGKFVRDVTIDSTDLVLWRPDSQGLFHVSNGALYYHDLTDKPPQLVSDRISAGMDGGIVWVAGQARQQP